MSYTIFNKIQHQLHAMLTLLRPKKSLGLLVLSATVTMYCGVAPHTQQQDSPDASVGTSQAALSPATNTKKNDTMSPSLRAAFIQTRQQEAGREFHFVANADSTSFAAHNETFSMRTQATEHGVHVQRGTMSEALTIALRSFGCVESMREVSNTRPNVRANRVEYARSGLTEWYVNGPMGIEQGFTVSDDAKCTGELGFEVDFGAGVSATLKQDGTNGPRAELRSGDQRYVYSDLFVKDASGKELAARMEVVGNRVRLLVDARGASYPLQVDPLVWVEQQKLTASDGADYDHFGWSVALSGDTALIGAPYEDWGRGGMPHKGAAYVFVRSGTTWTEQQKLTASDGFSYDYFGWSVALSGDTAVIGASQGGRISSGAAYVFVRSGTTWTEQQKLTASDARADDHFGSSVALSGDTAVVGAPDADWGGRTNSGAAYVFVRSGTTWTEQQKLMASDGIDRDYFGRSVALSGDTAVIGAQSPFRPAAYVYVRSGTTWTEQKKLTASDGSRSQFAQSVALSRNRDTVVVGQPEAQWGGKTFPGAAYVYRLAKSNGDTCAASAECHSGYCIDGVCCNSACGGGVATDCQACSKAAGAMTDGTCGPASATTVCNATGDPTQCAGSYRCDGTSMGSCPTTNPTPATSGTVCRASTGMSDPAEACDGTTTMCPPDVKADAGTPMDSGVDTGFDSGTDAVVIADSNADSNGSDTSVEDSRVVDASGDALVDARSDSSGIDSGRPDSNVDAKSDTATTQDSSKDTGNTTSRDSDIAVNDASDDSSVDAGGGTGGTSGCSCAVVGAGTTSQTSHSVWAPALVGLLMVGRRLRTLRRAR